MTYGNGHNLNLISEYAIVCEQLCIELRNQGGLIFPSKETVFVAGITIKKIERILYLDQLRIDC